MLILLWIFCLRIIDVNIMFYVVGVWEENRGYSRSDNIVFRMNEILEM